MVDPTSKWSIVNGEEEEEEEEGVEEICCCNGSVGIGYVVFFFETTPVDFQTP